MSNRVFIKEGDRFGRLTVIREIEKPKSLMHTHHHMVELRCDCGNITTSLFNNLRRGLTQSCGCYRNERQVESNITHGMSHSRLWRIWIGMRERCYDPISASYRYYGERGITVCNKWSDFIPFYKWAMLNGYEKTLTIDRIDVNGNYCPENCRWVTNIVQQNNRRNNIRFPFNGDELTIPEICRSQGFPIIANRVIWQKVHRDKMSITDAVKSYAEYINLILTGNGL